MFPLVLLNIPHVKVSSRWLWSCHWIYPLATRTRGISMVQNQSRIHFCASLIMNEENGLFCIVSTNVRNFALQLLFWQFFSPLFSAAFSTLIFPQQRILPLHSMSTETVDSASRITEGVELSTGVVESAADRRELALSGAAPTATCSCFSSSTQKFPSLYLRWVPKQLSVCLCSNSKVGKRKKKESWRIIFFKNWFFSPLKFMTRKMPQSCTHSTISMPFHSLPAYS